MIRVSTWNLLIPSVIDFAHFGLCLLCIVKALQSRICQHYAVIFVFLSLVYIY